MTVRCLTHGPMKHRFALDRWECVGFDGEGCSVQAVCAEDAELALAGWKSIPGAEVLPG